MGHLTADFHWHDREIGDQGPTEVVTHIRSGYAVILLRELDGPISLTMYLPNAAAAYTLASAVMTCGEQLEQQEQAAKGDPERPWIDVPLPLDEDQPPTAESLHSLRSGWNDDGVRAAVRESLGDLVDDCLVGRPEQCAELGCANESCPRF